MGSALSNAPVSLSTLTTMQVGGVPNRIISCGNTQQLYDAAIELWSSDEQFHVLAGGSNTVFAEDLEGLTILHVTNRGVEIVSEDAQFVTVQVQAGHSWDEFVAWAVTNDYAGIEAMS